MKTNFTSLIFLSDTGGSRRAVGVVFVGVAQPGSILAIMIHGGSRRAVGVL